MHSLARILRLGRLDASQLVSDVLLDRTLERKLIAQSVYSPYLKDITRK